MSHECKSLHKELAQLVNLNLNFKPTCMIFHDGPSPTSMLTPAGGEGPRADISLSDFCKSVINCFFFSRSFSNLTVSYKSGISIVSSSSVVSPARFINILGNVTNISVSWLMRVSLEVDAKIQSQFSFKRKAFFKY